MKNKRYSDTQIMGILKQAESGVPVSELCREHGMSNASFYKWRAKFGGMDASMISELKAMAEENRRLKRMYAEMSMQNDLLKEALGSCPFSAIGPRTMDERAKAVSAQRDGRESGRSPWGQHCAGLPYIPNQRVLLPV